MPENRVYGWRPSLPDARDLIADPPAVEWPSVVDPRDKLPPVYDQGQLGSCTANAVAAALQYHWDAPETPSRLFIYWFERKIEHQLGQGDTGAYGRDGFKVARKRGVPSESYWPYDIRRFDVKPGMLAGRKLEEPYKVVPQDENTIKSVLANGQTIAFGFTVYESFESQRVADTGDVPMPDVNYERVLGGHEVLAVGYDERRNKVLVRNSWGADWGDGGYCWFPWNYLLDSRYSGDLRTIVPAK